MILGIDPGVRKLGYALIQPDLKIIDAGILLQKHSSPTRLNQFERMVEISQFFEKLFAQYPIELVSVEQLFFTQFNQNNAEFVYGIRGHLLTLALQRGARIREFTPIQLKKYITGNAKAAKILIQKTVMKIFHLQELPVYNDAADALGLAYLATKLKF